MKRPFLAFCPYFLPVVFARSSHFTRVILNFKAPLLAVLWFALPLAWADDYDDVSKQIKSGNFVQALVHIDKALLTRPRDPQMRFYKGFVERETGQLEAATLTFISITEDYPELPEPYNNLAVIYALQNQLEKARAALEMALRNNPQYLTAHENLGDVYVRLAQESFAKGLKLDAGNLALASKIRALNDFVGVKPAP